MLIREADFISRRKTHNEYVEQVRDVNPNIDVIGEYIDSKTKVEHKCKIDGNKWFALPGNILNGHGCSECMKRILHNKFAKTHDSYVKEVANINPDIEVLGEYINASIPVLHRCKKHNVEWNALPIHILEGSGCTQCKGEKIYNNKVKSIEAYKYEVAQTVNNIEVVSEHYINARTPILHKCITCGHLWNISPDNVLRGYGCPECNFSKGEKEIKIYLINHNINYIPQYTFDDCRNIHVLPFDFYLPDYNLCIEYDGIQHFKPIEYFGGEVSFNETVKRDLIKTNYCIANNIHLLRIRYDENVVENLEQYFNNTRLIKEAV